MTREIHYRVGPRIFDIPRHIFWSILQTARGQASKSWEHHGSTRAFHEEIHRRTTWGVRMWAHQTGDGQHTE